MGRADKAWPHKPNIMETIVIFKDGFRGKLIKTLDKGHGDIRPPYNLSGAMVVKGMDFIGYLTVLPEGMEKMYGGEVEFSEVDRIETV